MSITYFALLFPVAVMFLLYRTQHGLNMRSIGEDPGTADAAGLSVNGWRIFYVSVGGAFAGLGGAVLTLGIVGYLASRTSPPARAASRWRSSSSRAGGRCR